MLAHQADVEFWFIRQQLLSDPYSTLDRKLVHNKLLLQHLITTPIQLNIF